ISCEYRAGASNCPTTASDTNNRGKYTFNSGGSTTQPPDTRASAIQRFGSYAPGVLETWSYQANTNRLAEVARPAPSARTLFTHDGLGRRTSDRDEFAIQSRRDYTYLPNGRLATVS